MQQRAVGLGDGSEKSRTERGSAVNLSHYPRDPDDVMRRSTTNVEAAVQLGLQHGGGGRFPISDDQLKALRTILAETSQLGPAIAAGLALPTQSDFRRFFGSLILNYENLLRGLGELEEVVDGNVDGDLSHNVNGRDDFNSPDRFDRGHPPNTIEEVLSIVPEHAKLRVLVPIVGKAQVGLEYTWANGDDRDVTIRLHSYEPDRGVSLEEYNGLPPDELDRLIQSRKKIHAASGWVFRVIVGDETMDVRGDWHVIREIRQPDPVADTGDVVITQLPRAFDSFRKAVDGIVAELVFDEGFWGSSARQQKDKLKADRRLEEILLHVEESQARFLYAHICGRVSLCRRQIAYVQYLDDLLRYEETMNNIHIPVR